VSTDAQQRHAAIDDLLLDVRSHCRAIQALSDQLPMGTSITVHRAIRDSVARCLDEVSEYAGRERARLAAQS